jgi:hypothetical protein
MEAQRKVYDSIPTIVAVPEKFVNKKVEVIFILDENLPQTGKKKQLLESFGAIPDFPNRESQGNSFEER